MGKQSAGVEVQAAAGASQPSYRMLDQRTLVSVSGNSVVLHDTETKNQTRVWGLGEAVGAFAVSPPRGVIAYADRGISPQIYIMRHHGAGNGTTQRRRGGSGGRGGGSSSSDVISLSAGTELEYASLAFSRDGKMLASLGGLPDFRLALWDWQEGELIASESLPTLACQHVLVCPLNSRRLLTWGPDQAVLWTLEEKYKSCAITHQFVPYDAAAHGSLTSAVWDRHGDVMLGTSRGHLMLVTLAAQEIDEDGNVIADDVAGENFDGEALELRQCLPLPGALADQASDAAIVQLQLTASHVVLARANAVLQFYSTSEERIVRTAAIDVEPRRLFDLILAPDYVSLWMLGAGAGSGREVSKLTVNPDIIDERGVLAQPVLAVPAGPVAALACLPGSKNRYITAGSDSVLRLWSGPGEHPVPEQLALFTLPQGDAVVALSACPVAALLAAATEHGRVYLIHVDASQNDDAPPALACVWHSRLHTGPAELAWDASGAFLASAGRDARLFLLQRSGLDASVPAPVLGHVSLPSAATCVTWHLRDTSDGIDMPDVFVGTTAGDLLRFTPPNQEPGASPSTLLQLSNHELRRGILRVDSMAVAMTPAPAAACGEHLQTSVSDEQWLFTLNADAKLKMYGMPQETGDPDLMDDTDIALPDDDYDDHQKAGRGMALSGNNEWLATGTSDGSVVLRRTSKMEESLVQRTHDPFQGGVSRVAFTADSQYIVSAGYDGVVFVSALSHAPAPSHSPPPLLPINMPAQLPALPPHADADERTFLQQLMHEQQMLKERASAQAKAALRAEIEQLRQQFQELLGENAKLPELEKLERGAFTVDFELRDRKQAEAEQAVAAVREEIKLENLGRELLCERIKEQCWDSMKSKGAMVVGFKSDISVQAYPLRETSRDERLKLDRVRILRRVELVEQRMRSNGRNSGRTSRGSTGSGGGNDRLAAAVGDEEDTPLETLVAATADDNELLYSPFELHTRQRKVTQMHLLAALIQRSKEQFNLQVDEYLESKAGIIAQISERNERIREIMQELGTSEALLQPAMQPSEQPELVLTVRDDEVNAQKVLPSAEQARLDERNRLEAKRAADAEDDDAGERALRMMMGGQLDTAAAADDMEEMMEQPEWMKKNPEELSDEEQRAAREWEKKMQQLKEEREKRRKALETELRKLQCQNNELASGFDERLQQLFEHKLRTQQAVYEKELVIIHLASILLQDEKHEQREQQLVSELEGLKYAKAKTTSQLNEFRRNLEAYRAKYDVAVSEDRVLDRSFKRDFVEFEDYFDVLFKMFKRRPRPQAQSSVPPETVEASADPFAMHDFELARESAGALVDVVNAETDKPEGLDDGVWQQFLDVRSQKMASEARVRRLAGELGDMTDFMHALVEQDEDTRVRIEAVLRELGEFRDERVRFAADLPILFNIKQGQVEVDQSTVVTDYSDCLLLHNSAVQEVNDAIKQLGQAKVELLLEIKETRKGIHALQWENKKLDMQADDLVLKTRDFQLLRVTKQLQELIKGGDSDRHSQEVAMLEKRADLSEKSHQHKVADKRGMVQRLERLLMEKREENAALDEEIKRFEASVSERQQIFDVQNARSNGKAAGAVRMREITNRRQLMDLSKQQETEVKVLRSEVERLRLRTFPSFQAVDSTPPDFRPA